MQQWYVVQSHSSKEYVANLNLSRQGFQTFVPVHLQPVSRQRPRFKPLFLGYLFVLFDPDRDRWTPIMHTYGVRRLLSSAPGMPSPIQSSFIDGLKRQTRDSLEGVPSIRVLYEGCMVRIKRGPLMGQHAVVRMTTAERVKLMLHGMGTEIEVEFGVNDVERLSSGDV